MNSTIEKKDNELIIYLEQNRTHNFELCKMSNFNSNCLKGTKIQISQNIISYINNPEFTSNSKNIGSNYFLEFSKKIELIDFFPSTV